MSTNKGNEVVDDIKSGFKGFFNTGEAIRGKINESIAHTFNDKGEEAKNQAIAEKGMQGMRETDERLGHHHGIASNSGVRTGGVGTNTAVTGETTGAGTHSGAPGNLGGSAAGGVAQGSRVGVQEDAATTQRY